MITNREKIGEYDLEDLIEELQRLKEIHGNCEVLIVNFDDKKLRPRRVEKVEYENAEFNDMPTRCIKLIADF